MRVPDVNYFCGRSEIGMFSEIYFPKRAAYYGAIFDALRYGYKENVVKKYFQDHIDNLMDELKTFPDLFDPYKFTAAKLRKNPVSKEEALRRIDMYASPFRGWSIYSVDGVWFDENDDPVEEATQIVRILFRFSSSFTEKATQENCSDVLRAIIYWTINQRGHLKEYKAWDRGGESQFMRWHEPWLKQNRQKRLFAQKNFSAVATEAIKWIDDRALFVFGYLVRKFWEQVVKEKTREDQIWVTNFFDMSLNVVEKTKQPNLDT